MSNREAASAGRAGSPPPSPSPLEGEGGGGGERTYYRGGEWIDELRRMRDVEVHQAGSPGTSLPSGFEVSIFGKALAQISEDPKGTVVRYYDQGWRFTRETSIVQRLIRAERKRNKKRRPDA